MAGTVLILLIVVLRAGVVAMAGATVTATVPHAPTSGAAPQEAVVGDAGATNVVGRLGRDPEVETLVVEEDPDRGTELG